MDESVRVHFITTEDGDWVAMYVNGKLIAEGHSLSHEQVAEEIPGVLVTTEEWGIDELVPYGYSFPKELPDAG